MSASTHLKKVNCSKKVARGKKVILDLTSLFWSCYQLGIIFCSVQDGLLNKTTKFSVYFGTLLRSNLSKPPIRRSKTPSRNVFSGFPFCLLSGRKKVPCPPMSCSISGSLQPCRPPRISAAAPQPLSSLCNLSYSVYFYFHLYIWNN